MAYEEPKAEVAGKASELVQAEMGPYYDGGAYSLSMGAVAQTATEE